MRPLGVAGDLRLLPGCQADIDITQRRIGFGFETVDIVINRSSAIFRGERAQIGNLGFELGDRLFEIEIGAHGPSSVGLAQKSSTEPESGKCRRKTPRQRRRNLTIATLYVKSKREGGCIRCPLSPVQPVQAIF